MKKKQSSIDGFIPRKPSTRLGDLHGDTGSREGSFMDRIDNDREMVSDDSPRKMIGDISEERLLGRADLDESLRSIDETQAEDKNAKKRKFRRKRGTKGPVSKKRKVFKIIIIILIVAILGAAGYIASRFLNAGSNIFQGSIFDVFQGKALKQDANGRTNFLIIGTSEDSPEHPGGELTDSMIVLSLSEQQGNAYMFSVPRDLYVRYGRACPEGYQGKINSYNSCVAGTATGDVDIEGLNATKGLVGEIFGLDIQYGIKVNHTVIKEAVNAVGGVDVDVQGSNGDPGVLDRNFDWRCNYQCYLVRYDNGVHHLDGDQALYLSMARGSVPPTYGLGNSNFDREKNQQKILIALKDKATSTGTLTNLGAVVKLIESLGNNLKTNLEMAEIRSLIKLSNEINTEKVHSIDLFDKDNSVVKTGGYNGASVVMPKLGLFEYSELQEFIKMQMSSDPIVREAAGIAVLNGSGVVGVGQEQANKLTEQGYRVTIIDNAPQGSYSRVEIYYVGSDADGTVGKLEALYNTMAIKENPPVNYGTDVQVVIIFGEALEQQ